MRINAQQRADSKPFSEASHFHFAITRVHAQTTRQGRLSIARSQSGSLPLEISANTAIHQSLFLTILILTSIYSLSSYTSSSFRSSRLIPYATYVRDVSYFHPHNGSCSLLPRAHSNCRIKFNILQYCSCCVTYICAKGLIQVTTTSFILVIYMRWAFKFKNEIGTYILELQYLVDKVLSDLQPFPFNYPLACWHN